MHLHFDQSVLAFFVKNRDAHLRDRRAAISSVVFLLPIKDFILRDLLFV